MGYRPCIHELFRGEKWRKGWDLNPRNLLQFVRFRVECVRPLCHPSVGPMYAHCADCRKDEIVSHMRRRGAGCRRVWAARWPGHLKNRRRATPRHAKISHRVAEFFLARRRMNPNPAAFYAMRKPSLSDRNVSCDRDLCAPATR